MASKLVGVRLPPDDYRRLQRHKRALGIQGNSEAVRFILRDYSPVVTLDRMPLFSAPLRSPGRKARRGALARIDDIVYGPLPRKRAPRRRRRA